jgi:hypothetical protein
MIKAEIGEPLLMRFPFDYWSSANIQNAIASFGCLILWENERDHLTRILVRSRITDLQDVPHYIVFTNGEGFHGQSTVQCEILEQQLLDVLPAAEDPIPQLNGPPLAFDFFGLGQSGAGNQEQANDEGNAVGMGQNADPQDLLPNDIEAQQEQSPDLNLVALDDWQDF